MNRVREYFKANSKQLRPAVLFGAFAALVMAFYLKEFDRRYDEDRLVSHLPWQETLRDLELRQYDAGFFWRGESRQRDPRAIIIAVDTETLGAFAGKGIPFPFPRTVWAKIIAKLKKADAKVIVFDMRFETPQPDSDPLLVEAAKAAGNVITSGEFRASELRHGTSLQVISSRPFTELDDVLLNVGMTTHPVDPDNFSRRFILSTMRPGKRAGGDESYPSLGTAAAAAFAGIPVTKLDVELAKNRFANRKVPLLPVKYPTQVEVNDGKKTWKEDIRKQYPRSRYALLDFLGPAGTVKTIGVHEIESDTPNSWGGDMAVLKKIVGGKMVFIGATDEALHDNHPTPFDVAGTKTPGVEIHANTALALLDRRFIQMMPTRYNIAITFFFSILAAVLTILLGNPVSNISQRVDSRVNVRVRGVRVRLYNVSWLTIYTLSVLVPSILAIRYLALLAFTYERVWLYAVHPSVSVVTTYMVSLATMFLTVEQDRKKAQGRFEHLVAPAVLAEILKHPGEAEELPKPRRVEATLVFTDLQGFTTLSEQNTAEKVVEVLNEYISRMNEVIFKRGGTIDKYEGDAIMIEFGVPVPQPDHAVRAVLCAIDMQEACTKFRNEVCRPNGWPDLYMRIGINSGEVIAGLIGGGDRFDYTTIGDTVNLAARLEPLNKQTHSWILCGDRTYGYVKDLVVAEAVPGIQVKGKTQAVDVYAVHGTIESGRRDLVWGEGADRAPKAPTESSIGAAQKEPEPAEANDGLSPEEAREPASIGSGT